MILCGSTLWLISTGVKIASQEIKNEKKKAKDWMEQKERKLKMERASLKLNAWSLYKIVLKGILIILDTWLAFFK